MTLEQEINEAAFWEEWVCLGCGERFREEQPAAEVECECQAPLVVEARVFQRVLARIDAEREN